MAAPDHWAVRVLEAAMKVLPRDGRSIDVFNTYFLNEVLEKMSVHTEARYPARFGSWSWACPVCGLVLSIGENRLVLREDHELLHRRQVFFVLTASFCLEPSWEHTNEPAT